MNPEEILYKASRDHRKGRLKRAEGGYRAVLAMDPGRGAVWNALGAVLEGLGRPREALEAYENAVRARDPYPQGYYNIGRLRQASNDTRGAVSAYGKLLEAVPGFAPGWNNLGDLLRQLGEMDQGIRCLKRAISLSPGQPSFWNNLGVALDQAGSPGKAVEALRRALELDPHYKAAIFNLAQIHHRLEDYPRARALYERLLELDPSNAQADFLYKSIQGERSPEAAPVPYIQKVFDDCASSFEDTLVNELCYRTPEALFRALRPHLSSGMAILDLGCGTGLGSELFRPFAREYIGMDVSSGMLEKARKKGTYHRLIQQDILAPWDVGGGFDLIYSCDCFVYIGDLSSVSSRAHRHLEAGGLFAFSVEELPQGDGPYRLLPTGRYAHSRAYLESLLERHGFSILFARREGIRREGQREVEGLLLGARKV